MFPILSLAICLAFFARMIGFFFRSAYDVTMDAMNNCPSLKTIAIIAEGIPENFTRNIIKTANEKVREIITVEFTRLGRCFLHLHLPQQWPNLENIGPIAIGSAAAISNGHFMHFSALEEDGMVFTSKRCVS